MAGVGNVHLPLHLLPRTFTSKLYRCMQEKERDLAREGGRKEGERKNPSAFGSGGSVLELAGTGSAQHGGSPGPLFQRSPLQSSALQQNLVK